MNDRTSKVRMRYTGKTGYHGLKHWKVYEISIVSKNGKLWEQDGSQAIAYDSLALLCRNWADV